MKRKFLSIFLILSFFLSSLFLLIPNVNAVTFTNPDVWNYENYAVGKAIIGLKVSYLYNDIFAISYGLSLGFSVQTKTFSVNNVTGIINQVFVDTEAENSGFGSASFPSNLVLYANHTYGMTFCNEFGGLYVGWIISYIVGSHGDLTDNGKFSFEPIRAVNSVLSKIENSNYMGILYRDELQHGIIATITFNSTDSPVAKKDVWDTFDTNCINVYYFSHVALDTYLIVYGSDVNVATLSLLQISNTGFITESLIDSYTISNAINISCAWLSPNILGIVYKDSVSNDGCLKTFNIDASDISVVDMFVFDASTVTTLGISTHNNSIADCIDIIYSNSTSALIRTMSVDISVGTINGFVYDSYGFYSGVPSKMNSVGYDNNISVVVYNVGAFPNAISGYIETVKRIGTYNFTSGVSGLKTINIVLRDVSTSNSLIISGIYSGTPLGNNNIKCAITSELWSSYYLPWSSDITSITASFVNGHYYSINFNDIVGNVNGEYTYFYNYTEYFQWYDGLTYTFYITPIGYNEGYNNKAFDEQSGLYSYLESDKTSYIYGETIRMRYKIPTTQELQNAGLHTGHWWACLFRDNPWYLITPSIEDSYHSDTTPLLCVEDNQWHFFNFIPPNPSDNIDTYECTIQEPSWWIFYQALITLQNALKFNVYKVGDFIASGNITSISPSTPKLGQQTTITFNANNDGIIKIKHVDSSKYIYISNFIKPLGLATTKLLPSLFGLYSVELYVSNGVNYSIEDVANFFVNETEGGYGKYGTAEFLYIPYRRAIAGYDNITIMYHSLKNNSLLQIKDSTGAIYPASTYVSNIPNTLVMPLPTYAEIGIWNVTLFGNETLSASFYVIAEEGNYVEFSKHYFYSNENFKVNIQHTKKVALEFYKDGIPTGKNAILQDNEMPFGVLDIPPDIAPISTGSWSVEMWEINNNIRIKLLASDTCIVIYGNLPSTTPDIGFGISFSGLDAVVKAVVGIIIVVLLTFTPLLFSVMSSKGTSIAEIEIPALVYIAMFLFGVFICVLLELFPVGALFFVIFGLIIALAILWVQRKIAD